MASFTRLSNSLQLKEVSKAPTHTLEKQNNHFANAWHNTGASFSGNDSVAHLQKPMYTPQKNG